MKLINSILALFCTAVVFSAEQVPLHISAPHDCDKNTPLTVTSGVPFARGQVANVDQIKVMSQSTELDAQVQQTAQWPDGSVKWALIDFSTSVAKSKKLSLHFGGDVKRKAIKAGLSVQEDADGISINGKQIKAVISRSNAHISLTAGSVQTSIVPVLEAMRLNKASDLIPGSRSVSNGTVSQGTFKIDSAEIEHQGALRVRIVLRGHVAMPKWASTLPDNIARLDPRGEIPFSLRYTIYRDKPLVQVDQKIVYTGEPDLDMIARWGFDVLDQGTAVERRVKFNGVTIDAQSKGEQVVNDGSERTCWVPLKNGLALINDGWQNRPSQLGGNYDGHARVDFWSSSFGPWDLRRYAREWATGESARKNIEFFSKYAARGMAKSQRFALYLGKHDGLKTAIAHAQPSLAVANPKWYQDTKVFGHYRASVADTAYAKYDEAIIRYLDYMIFNQDLYKWYDKLHYGFWQSRNGQIHRNDRWNRDYGRWGWALGDGAGRYTHALMFQFIRNLDRNYFLAGDAACRIVYDTSMIHTNTYMENAQNAWWRIKGSNHRHNVQAFGCPYTGMRGSYPYGQRILYLLTGDGLIADGLDIVKEAAINKITRKIDQALGNSGGTDGMGTATLVLLHAYEQTGNKKYLDYIKKYFTNSKVFTIEKVRLGYGPSFGLFTAAIEYLDVSGDEAFKKDFLALAERGLTEKKQNNFVAVFAQAYRISKDQKYLAALKKVLAGVKIEGSLCELPRNQWPGHGGARTSPSRSNQGRDFPYAWAVLLEESKKDVSAKINAEPILGSIPKSWVQLNQQKISTKTTGKLPENKLIKVTAADGIINSGESEWLVKGNAISGSHNAKGLINALQVFSRQIEDGKLSAEQNVNLQVAVEEMLLSAQGTVASAGLQVHAIPLQINGHHGIRLQLSIHGNENNIGECGIRLAMPFGKDGKHIHLCSPGAFRIERWRVDQNDEQIPEWLNSDSQTRWPLWRHSGIICGKNDDYRIVRANRRDTSLLTVDEGVASPRWFDVSKQGFGGCTVRFNELPVQADTESSILYNSEDQALEIRFIASSGQFISADVQASVDILLHDEWRPPLQANVLNKQQFTRLINDLEYGENIGLFAYRFRLSTSHKVKGQAWKDKIMASGVRASELLFSMAFRDALPAFCKKIKVPYDAKNIEHTVIAIINHYRK